MRLPCDIQLADKWLDTDDLEKALRRADRFTSPTAPVVIHFPADCKVMIGTAVRILALADQLVTSRRKVTLDFAGPWNPALGYLHRAGFFTKLDRRVKVLPERPDAESAAQYQGRSGNLVEFRTIPPGKRAAIRDLPDELADRLEAIIEAQGRDPGGMGQDVYTLFAELIDNIFDHSQTQLAGTAALQFYPRGSQIQVAVSDSGIGLLESLRPTLGDVAPSLQEALDSRILQVMFEQGLSRCGEERGMGLKRCADVARKYKATIDLRIRTSQVTFIPALRWFSEQIDYQEGLPPIQGTHFCFSFHLDS
jgi:hypothetical protein